MTMMTCADSHECLKMHKEVERLRAQRDELLVALQYIQSWSEAYPLNVFPEPDYEKARRLLGAGGITLDSISADCMRHVVEGVGGIVRAAIARAEQNNKNEQMPRL